MPKPRKISDEILGKAVAAYRARKRIPSIKELARQAGVTPRGMEAAVEMVIAGKRVVSHVTEAELDRMADELLES